MLRWALLGPKEWGGNGHSCWPLGNGDGRGECLPVVLCESCWAADLALEGLVLLQRGGVLLAGSDC